MLVIIGVVWSYFSPLVSPNQIATWNVCPLNLFLDHGRCVECRRCDQFSIEINPCSFHSDTKCLSCEGENSKLRECQECPPCGKGSYVHSRCRARKPTKCKRCPKGSFNPKISYSEVCSPCTSCHAKKRILIAPCTRHSDTLCGGCKRGYYMEHGSGKCVQCRTCLNSGHDVVRKCQEDDTGRDCGLFLGDIFHDQFHQSWTEEDDVLLKELTAFPAVKEDLLTTSVLRGEENKLNNDLDHTKILLSYPQKITIIVTCSIVFYFIFVALVVRFCCIKKEKDQMSESVCEVGENQAFVNDQEDIDIIKQKIKNEPIKNSLNTKTKLNFLCTPLCGRNKTSYTLSKEFLQHMDVMTGLDLKNPTFV